MSVGPIFSYARFIVFPVVRFIFTSFYGYLNDFTGFLEKF